MEKLWIFSASTKLSIYKKNLLFCFAHSSFSIFFYLYNSYQCICSGSPTLTYGGSDCDAITQFSTVEPIQELTLMEDMSLVGSLSLVSRASGSKNAHHITFLASVLLFTWWASCWQHQGIHGGSKGGDPQSSSKSKCHSAHVTWDSPLLRTHMVPLRLILGSSLYQFRWWSYSSLALKV